LQEAVTYVLAETKPATEHNTSWSDPQPMPDRPLSSHDARRSRESF
jgi:hypothetical protein